MTNTAIPILLAAALSAVVVLPQAALDNGNAPARNPNVVSTTVVPLADIDRHLPTEARSSCNVACERRWKRAHPPRRRSLEGYVRSVWRGFRRLF